MALAKHQPKRNHNRADKCSGHVLLGVPDVALRSEIGRAELATEERRGPSFDELVVRRSGHRDRQRQIVSPESAYPDAGSGSLESDTRGENRS